MNEVNIICGDINQPHYVKGITAYCVSCDKEVYLSDSSVQGSKKKYPEAKINPICISCASKQGLFSHLKLPFLEQIEDIKKNL